MISKKWLIAAGLMAAALTSGGTASAQDADKQSDLRPWTLRVHYWRANADYAGWGVYSWKGPNQGAPKWPANWKFTGKDKYGTYYDVMLGEGASSMEFLITDGKGNKNCQKDQKFQLPGDLAQKGAEIWLRENECTIHTSQPKRSLID